MNRTNRIALGVIRSPLVWGALATLAFYTLIHAGGLNNEFVNRYFAGHWIEYVEASAFFVGLAWLVLKAFDVAEQRTRVDETLLGSRPATPRPAIEAENLLAQLNELPEGRQSQYLPRRLRETLEFVLRKGSADSLDEQLQYLSEVDAQRAHAGYGLVRLIIWAIPILGFLGTVVGITLAIAQLTPEALENSLTMVLDGLSTAFDTTALALSLSIVLMVGQYQVDRKERQLLELVDRRAADELAGRFEQLGDNNPQLSLVRRMAETVIRSSERLVERQAELWQETVARAHEHWSKLADGNRQQIETALAAALDQSLTSHAERLAEVDQSIAESNRAHWNEVQQALVKASEASAVQQAALAEQGETLLRVVDATGQVTRLEQTLNQNLAALSGAQHFEETLLNLSSTLSLINARLGHTASDGGAVKLQDKNPSGKAA